MDTEHLPDVEAHSASTSRLDDKKDRVVGSGPRRGWTDKVATIGTTFSGEVTLWTSAAQSMFGWTEREARGRQLRDLADWGLTANDFAEFLFVASGGAWTRELQVTNRDGRTLALRLTAMLAAGPDGSDEIITTLQRLSKTGADQPDPGTERPFRLIAERGSDLVVICDRDMVITYAGASLKEVYGYLGRDVIGTPGWQYVHPQEAPRLLREWELAVAGPGDHRELELRIRDADGAWRWVQLRISNLFADVAISAMVLNLRDITDQRWMADRMAASERALAELMDAAMEGVWVLDTDGRTVMANHRLAELLKIDYTRLCSGSIYDFIDPVAAEFIEQRLGHRAAGVREQYEFSFVRRDGSRRWFHVSGVPRYDPSGTFIGSIAMCTDITDRKLLERELERRGPAEFGTGEAVSRRAEDGDGVTRPAGGFGAAGRAEPREADPEPVPGLDRLSRREFEVVKLLLRGDRVPVIARQLFVSQSTVRNHLSSVFRKLRVRSQQELIVLLRERTLPN